MIRCPSVAPRLSVTFFVSAVRFLRCCFRAQRAQIARQGPRKKAGSDLQTKTAELNRTGVLSRCPHGLQRTTLNSITLEGEIMRNCYALRRLASIYERNGEGGIRTLGSLLGYGALAKRCFQPLSHLTKNRARISRRIADCQQRPPFVCCRRDVATALCAVRTSHRDVATGFVMIIRSCQFPIAH